MKNRIKLLMSVVAVSLLALTGCKNITPQQASGAATLAVYAYGTAQPQNVPIMRVIQPAACDVVKNPGATIEDVVGVIENTAGVNEQTKAIINVLLTIYQTSITPVGTNQSQIHPYLEAVICPGWAGGLALLPSGPLGAAGVADRKSVV